MDEPVPAGTIVPARLIGVIEALQTEKDGTKETNDRLIAVAATHELFTDVHQLSEVPESVTAQIEHFFISYNEQQGKRFEPKGRHGRKRAETLMEKGRRAYKRKKK
jgi:inorganic pyrophosphatase